MKPLLDLDAPILPSIGVAELRVGVNVFEYRDILFHADITGGLEWQVVGLWSVLFRFGQAYEETDEERDAFSTAFERSRVRVEEGLEPDLDLEAVMPTPPPTLPAVEMRIDLRDGTVFALAALSGYSGRLLDKIFVGMALTDAEAKESRLFFDATNDEVRLRGVDGVSLLLDVNDPEPEDLTRATIDRIVVFDPERIDGGKWLLPI